MTVEKQPSTPTGPVSAPSLAARFERLPITSYQRYLLLIVTTAFLFDSMDVTFLTFVLAPISTDLGMSPVAAGLLASATFMGMAIGGSAAGILSDHFGRRPIFAFSMLFWGFFSLVMAFSWNTESLIVSRLLVGIGLGAELPVALALLSEFLPSKKRGWYMGWLPAAGISIAFLVSGGMSLLLVPWLGWRSVFVLMFALSLFGWYIRRSVPESPRWYESRGRHEQADVAMTAIEARVEAEWGRTLPAPAPEPVTVPTTVTTGNPLTLLLSRHYRRRTLMAWGLWFFGLLGYYGIVAWVAKILVDNGMTVTGSIAVVLLMQVWGLPGFVVAAQLLERLGRRPILVAAIVLSAAAAYLYGTAHDTAAVIICGSIMQFCLLGMWTSIYTYTPELFPTRARATGTGGAQAVGRLGAIVGPLAVPVLLVDLGYASTFAMVSMIFLLAAILVLLFGPETRGRVLEEVSG